jgi:hypothetical protein
MRILVRPLLAILSLLALTPNAWPQTQDESPMPPSSDYGIEPEKLYPGSILLELIQTAEGEIDNAAEEAYAEGYKAASLRHAPDAEYYKTVSESLRIELGRLAAQKRREKWRDILIPGAVGFAIGVLGFGAYNLATQ